MHAGGTTGHRADARVQPEPRAGAPIARLLGHRTTHVAAGTATLVMPASDACISPNGQIEIVPAAVAALEGATGTALPAGMDAVAMRFTFKAFRPAWPGKGNLLARARVVNDSNLFVFAEVQVEDPEGRYLGLGTLHSMIQPVEPAPPPPPVTMKRIEEAVYPFPDRELPLTAVSFEVALAASLPREVSALPQFGDESDHAVAIPLELRGVGANVAIEKVHSARRL